MMNGISVNSKQGSEPDVLGFVGTGESPTLPERSGGKAKRKKIRKTSVKSKKSLTSSSTKGIFVQIQDGAECTAGTIITDVPDLAQLENMPDPPVLSIPDTAADNETISRLLGGQGAALLDLGSSDNVNIDLVQENIPLPHDTVTEDMTSSNQSPARSSAVSGVSREASPRCRGSGRRATGGGVAGKSRNAGTATPATPAVTASVSVGSAAVKNQHQQQKSSTFNASALDLSMKSDKMCVLSASEVLSNMSREILTSESSTETSNKSCNKILLNSADFESNLITVATVSPKSPGGVPAEKADDDFSASGEAEAEVTDSKTGDGLLLNIAQINNANSNPSDSMQVESDQNATTSGSLAPQSGNPMTYIITSRDKSTGVTQRFRVTVDPESVMYIPVMNLGPESSAGTGDDEVSLVPCEAGGSAKEGSEVVEGSMPVSLLKLNSEGVTAVTSGGKEDLTAMTGDEISCSLILQGSEAIGSKDKMDIDDGKHKDHAWTKKSQQRRKEGQEVLNCDHPGCDATIIGKSKFRIHKLGHNDNRPHKCPHDGCDWSFPSLYKLRRHIAGHTGAKPFVCGMDNCGKQFSTIYNLKMHLNSHFRQTMEVCDYEGCGKIFNSAPLLKIHKRKHFEEQRLKCEFPGCPKTFTTSSALGSHQRVHERDATNYPCPFEGCTKVYDKACRLKLHMRSHTGERPFKCTFEGCDWAFTCIQKLTRHLVRHTGERKYQCKFEGCSKLFTRLEHLKSHEVFHSGEKPFGCKEVGCNARFAARSSLYMHQKRHLQGKPLRERLLFSCPLDGCDMSFASKLGLKSHIIKGHGIPIPFTGGAGDFELIGLGNDQLHAAQPESPQQASSPTILHIPTQPSASSSSGVSSLPTITLSTIPADLMASPLLQPALIPPTSSTIPLSTLTSSHDEAASILASGLLQNQFYLNRPTLPVNLTMTTKDAGEPDPIPSSTAASVSATPTSVLTVPSSSLTTSSSSLTASHLLTASSSSGAPNVSSAASVPMTMGQLAPSLLIPSALMTSGSIPATYVATTLAHVPTATASSAAPRVYLENRSGSARTDFRAVTAKHPLPPDAEQTKKFDIVDAETLSQSDSSLSSEGSVQASFIPLNMMTSASLTLRDPATGTRYIQTQLLQDDPPDMPDMGFHLSSHDAPDRSPLNPSSLSVSAMLDETGSDHNSDPDFMTSDGVMSEDMAPSFRESTINLQDLE